MTERIVSLHAFYPSGDTGVDAYLTIDYVATDTAGNTATSSKTKLIVCAPEFPIPFTVARAGQPTRQLAGRAGCEEKPRRSGV
jgi:hypothetical protein